MKTIPATEARIHFGEILKRVHASREQFIVEKDGLEVAAILGREDYEQYRRLLALEELEKLNRTVNREMLANGLSEKQALAELRKTKKQTFKAQYGNIAKSRRIKAA